MAETDMDIDLAPCDSYSGNLERRSCVTGLKSNKEGIFQRGRIFEQDFVLYGVGSGIMDPKDR